MLESADHQFRGARGVAARSWRGRVHGALKRDRHVTLRLYLAGMFMALVVVAALIGYRLGQATHSKASVTTLTGIAYTNATYQTEVTVGGWTYNVPRGVATVNAEGTYVDDNRPLPCLRPGRSAPITFGMIPVKVATLGIRAVVWVQCGVRGR